MKMTIDYNSLNEKCIRCAFKGIDEDKFKEIVGYAVVDALKKLRFLADSNDEISIDSSIDVGISFEETAMIAMCSDMMPEDF